MSNEYWSIIVDAICDATDVQFDANKTARVISILIHAHADYGEQHGHHEADKSLRRMNNDSAREGLFCFIEEQMSALDSGPNFFDRLSVQQKEALAYLLMARKEFAKRNRVLS